MLMACALLLCGCVPHREYHIINDTGADLELLTELGAIPWPDQESIHGDVTKLFSITELEHKNFSPVLTINKMGRVIEYGLPPIPDKYRARGRKYHYYLQIDSQDMIWILNPPNKHVEDLLGFPQPEGFPTSPLTNKAEQLRLLIRDPDLSTNTLKPERD